MPRRRSAQQTRPNEHTSDNRQRSAYHTKEAQLASAGGNAWQVTRGTPRPLCSHARVAGKTVPASPWLPRRLPFTARQRDSERAHAGREERARDADAVGAQLFEHLARAQHGEVSSQPKPIDVRGRKRRAHGRVVREIEAVRAAVRRQVEQARDRRRRPPPPPRRRGASRADIEARRGSCGARRGGAASRSAANGWAKSRWSGTMFSRSSKCASISNPWQRRSCDSSVSPGRACLLMRGPRPSSSSVAGGRRSWPGHHGTTRNVRVD